MGRQLPEKYEEALRILYCYDKAIEVVNALADEGDIMAMYQLGCSYYYGDIPVHEGVIHFREYYEKKGFEWFERAAQYDMKSALLNLGNCYRKGEGCQADIDKGRECIMKAAENGPGDLQLFVGEIFLQGEEVKKDTQTAINWFQKAIDYENYLPARRRMAYAYLKEYTNQAYQDKARSLFEELAFKENDPESYGYLSNIYRDGLGVPSNLEKAYTYCKKGAEMGDQWCKQEIDHYQRTFFTKKWKYVW